MATVSKISNSVVMTGDLEKANAQLATAKAKLEATYAKAEAKAEAAGTECPTTNDSGTAVSQAADKVNDNVTRATGTRFVDNGDGTITDRSMSLQWEKKDFNNGIANLTNPHDADNTYTWGGGVPPYAHNGTVITDFLAKLNGGGGAGTCFAGQCDWRLPTLEEQRSLLLQKYPNCPSNPCVDSIFTPLAGETYWSATADRKDPSTARVVNFADGQDLDSMSKATNLRVQAVRTVPPLRTASALQCGDTTKCVFVTSTVSKGNFGGLAAADAICNSLAASTQMPGTYVAWLSDEMTSAYTRVTSTGPYATRSGIVVTTNFPDSFIGPFPLDAGIAEDENGDPVFTGTKVWTGTLYSGFQSNVACLAWTSILNSDSGTVGLAGYATTAWQEAADVPCDDVAALYCIQN